MKIIPLSEGSFTIDNTKIFIPFDKATHDLQQRPAGSLLVEIQPFVVITKKDIILFDTGLGFYSENGKMQIHNNLLHNGINPSHVTKILLSHLHKDHAGGILNKREQLLSFPAAMYYVNKKEMEYAQQQNSLSYHPEDFSLLPLTDKMVLLDDAGIINNYIHYEMCGGHCPYHTVFWIKEEEEIIFYGGDVAPQQQQMKNRFVAKYDYDGKKSMELRTNWWQQGKQEHWTFLFYHDIKSPFVKA